MRLAMKPYLPGAAFTRTLTLPMRRQPDPSAWIVSSAVSGAWTSSTSFMIGAGLNQCMPMNRGRRVSDTALFSSPMTRPDVFVANTACGCTMPSTAAQPFFFSSTFLGPRLRLLVLPRLPAPLQAGAAVDDGGAGLLDQLAADVADGDLEAAGGERLADAGAHDAAAEDACAVDLDGHVGTSSSKIAFEGAD